MNLSIHKTPCCSLFIGQQFALRACFRLFRQALGAIVLLLAAVLQPIHGASNAPLPIDRHWAFEPPRDIAPPDIAKSIDRQWIQSPMDQFVLSKLQENHLDPAPRADQRTLIRRATFDLIGLPPTSEEIADFLDDLSPDAFAKVVNRLLASPRYGERWGRHWLDVARYSDSNGLDENLVYNGAWRYRDYVIAAFNKDKPYDQFIQEQLAGDLLPGSDNEAQRYEHLIATGLLSLGAKMLAEDDPMKMEMDIVDEQVDTVGRAFMGLTLGCARCHDHKFDPIPTADYYSLAGIFKSSKTMENFKVVAQWHEYVLVSEADQERFKTEANRIAEKKQGIEKRTKLMNDRLLADAREKSGAYLLACSTLLRQEEVASTADRIPKTVEQVAAELRLNEVIVKQWREYLQRTRSDTNSVLYPWRLLTVKSDAALETSSAIPAWLKNPIPSSPEELAARYQELFQKADQAWRDLQQNQSSNKAVKLADDTLETFRAVLYDAKGPFALPADASKMYSAEFASELKQLNEEVRTLELALGILPKAMGVKEGKVVNLPIHVRGNHLTLGKEVPRQFLQFIADTKSDPIDERQSGRLQLARWLTHPSHPLTSRVMVNRIWRGHFGVGLVRSVDNFGRLGELPSNQLLLDWLAKRFTDSGWSIKSMHRLIMLSSTYQMSSAHNDRAHLVDPENRLYWRKNRWRLEAEAIRDSIVAVSGQLDLAMGGSLLRFKDRDYVTSTASRDTTPYDASRRSVYLPVIRSALYEVFLAFDFNDPSVSNGDRSTTTVAPQALFMMNSPLVLKQTRKMAEQLLTQSNLNDGERIAAAYERTFGRVPSAIERDRALEFLQRCSAALAEREPNSQERRVRSWQSLCRTLVASNEFIYVE